MAEIEYDYDPVPTIRKFHRSRAFIRGLMGPFGSGKSSGCVIEIPQLGALQKPGPDGKRRSRFAVIRNTYRQLGDTTIKTFFDWLPDGIYGKWHKSEHRFVIDQLESDLEIEVMFRALDRPEHVANLLSLELTGAWVNEAREVPWAVIRALQGRVRRYPAVRDGGCVRGGIIMDTNPPDDESWWYRLFEEERPATAKLFKQPSGRSDKAENLANLPTNYYQNLMDGSDAEFIQVYVDGEYGLVKEGKPVYPDYVDSAHCDESVNVVPKVVIKRGWDFGLTPACVFTQVLPNGRFIAFDELCADDLGVDKFADAVLMHCSAEYDGFEFEDYGDPAGNSRADTDEKTCFQILQGKGIQIRPGDQTLTIRLESVRKGLNSVVQGRPQLMIHPRCKMLRKGFQGRYQYKRFKIAGAAERYHDKPDKNEYSHPHDALQYPATKVLGQIVKTQQTRHTMRPLQYDSRGIV